MTIPCVFPVNWNKEGNYYKYSESLYQVDNKVKTNIFLVLSCQLMNLKFHLKAITMSSRKSSSRKYPTCRHNPRLVIRNYTWITLMIITNRNPNQFPSCTDSTTQKKERKKGNVQKPKKHVSKSESKANYYPKPYIYTYRCICKWKC